MSKSFAKNLLLAILAGISIALGGAVFLMVDNKIIGSLLFTIGLFTVCTMGFNLFTGKVCYVLQNDRHYAKMLPVVWIGNLLGTWSVAAAFGCTRNAAAMMEKAAGLCAVKLGDSFLSLFFLFFHHLSCHSLSLLSISHSKKSAFSHNFNFAKCCSYISKRADLLIFGAGCFVEYASSHCTSNE